MAALRSAAEGVALRGTRRTTSRPKRVRTTSSPDYANFTSSVRCPFAWLTDVLMAADNLDQLMVQIKRRAYIMRARKLLGELGISPGNFPAAQRGTRALRQ